jgi:tRNA threonylcarbamoyladenosine biosynthesis protein TsaE
MQHIVDAADPCATEMLGRTLGQRLFPGAVLALTGQLGAGKTFLVRAIAEGLAVPDSRVVSSPTFVLIQEYRGRLPVYHFDAYRLRNLDEFAQLGAHEYFEGDGVCLVEWADRVEPILPNERLSVQIDVTGERGRRFRLKASGALYETLLREVRDA